MDPNAALRDLRTAIAKLRADDGADDGERLMTAAEVADFAEALDHWLSSGGFMPAAWRPGALRLDTASGVHGELVEWQSVRAEGGEGVAIVRRDDAPVPDRPYSVHHVYGERGKLFAEAGEYDLTLDAARADLRRRIS